MKRKGISNILSFATISLVLLIIGFSIYYIAFQQMKIGQQIITSEERRAEERLEEKISILYYGIDGLIVVNDGDRAVKIVKAYVDNNIIPLNEVINPKEDKLISIPYGKNLMLELSSGAIIKFIRFEPTISEPIITETSQETSENLETSIPTENLYITRTYTYEYLTITVFSIGINTLYFRGDTSTINGLNAYLLYDPQSNIGKESITIAGVDPAYFGIRIWKRSSLGVETEITSGSPIAQISAPSKWQSVPIGGSRVDCYSATWNQPEINLNPTDSIVVRVYGYGKTYDDPYEKWRELATFSTPQLGKNSLPSLTWTVYYYIEYIRGGVGQYGNNYKFLWGASSRNSRIENSDFYTTLTTSTYPTTALTTITKTPNENITLTIYTTTPILTYSYRTTTSPTLTSYSTSFSTSYSTYLSTSLSKSSYFTITGWVTKTYTITYTLTSTITYTYTFTKYYNATLTFASPYISTSTFKQTITIDPIIKNNFSLWIIIGFLLFFIIYSFIFSCYFMKSIKRR